MLEVSDPTSITKSKRYISHIAPDANAVDIAGTVYPSERMGKITMG